MFQSMSYQSDGDKDWHLFSVFIHNYCYSVRHSTYKWYALLLTLIVMNTSYRSGELCSIFIFIGCVHIILIILSDFEWLTKMENKLGWADPHSSFPIIKFTLELEIIMVGKVPKRYKAKYFEFDRYTVWAIIPIPIASIGKN